MLEETMEGMEDEEELEEEAQEEVDKVFYFLACELSILVALLHYWTI